MSCQHNIECRVSIILRNNVDKDQQRTELHPVAGSVFLAFFLSFPEGGRGQDEPQFCSVLQCSAVFCFVSSDDTSRTVLVP